MATLASLTLDVLDMIYGQTPATRPASDQLATSVSSNSDTSWRFELEGAQFWERGDYAEYDDGTGTAGEVVRLYGEHDTVGADVLVERAQRRTTAAASYAEGDVFLKNPAYTKTEIQKVINEVIDNDMQNGIWYRSQRTIAYSVGRDRYPVNASDYMIERMRQRDINATDLGTATFDFTGGGVEDEWTVADTSDLTVGDTVRFYAAGTGADEYGQGIIYYVAVIPSGTTVQLSATDSTTVLEGSADSVGTWSMELVVFDYREFNDGDYQLLTNQDTASEGTTRSVIVRRVASSADTIYYTARTRPSSDAVSSLPAELSNAVPYGVVARLAGGTAVRHRPASDSTIAYADAAWFRAEFNRMMDQTRMRLLKDLRPLPSFQFGPTTSGDYRGGHRGGFDF
jgi:hypothetical protein